MRLRYTLGSPFARIVRIVLDEKGLAYERTEELTTSAAEIRAADAPTLQVPAFEDAGLKLWDSAVIVEYLMERYPNAPAPAGHQPFAERLLRPGREIADRLQLATLQTLGVAAATVSQLRWSGVTLENDFAARNAERIGYLLDWAEREITAEGGFVPGVVSVQDVCLAAWLAFIDNRPIDLAWRSDARPKIALLVERLAARPSFAANPIWYWEPGVAGYEPDGTPIYGG